MDPLDGSVAMSTCLRAVGLLALAPALLACEDDFVVGDWLGAEAACADLATEQISITEDLTGTGALIVGCNGDASLVCPASMYASESLTKEGMWELQADFAYCDAVGQDLGRRFKDCQENGTDQLRCCNPDGSGCTSYLRQ
jgi:hypothetical protein